MKFLNEFIILLIWFSFPKTFSSEAVASSRHGLLQSDLPRDWIIVFWPQPLFLPLGPCFDSISLRETFLCRSGFQPISVWSISRGTVSFSALFLRPLEEHWSTRPSALQQGSLVFGNAPVYRSAFYCSLCGCHFQTASQRPLCLWKAPQAGKPPISASIFPKQRSEISNGDTSP